jgi:hypothetical protein
MTDYNEKLCKWVIAALQSFINDKPDSDFQFGYLTAVLAVAYEAGLQTHATYIAASKLHEEMTFVENNSAVLADES